MTQMFFCSVENYSLIVWRWMRFAYPPYGLNPTLLDAVSSTVWRVESFLLALSFPRKRESSNVGWISEEHPPKKSGSNVGWISEAHPPFYRKKTLSSCAQSQDLLSLLKFSFSVYSWDSATPLRSVQNDRGGFSLRAEWRRCFFAPCRILKNYCQTKKPFSLFHLFWGEMHIDFSKTLIYLRNLIVTFRITKKTIQNLLS